MNEQYLKLTVWLGNFARVRDLLRAMQFMGADVRWIEGSGWLLRNFLIAAAPCVMQQVVRELKLFGMTDYKEIESV